MAMLEDHRVYFENGAQYYPTLIKPLMGPFLGTGMAGAGGCMAGSSIGLQGRRAQQHTVRARKLDQDHPPTLKGNRSLTHPVSMLQVSGSKFPGPSSQCLRTLVPKTIQGMVVGTRVLQHWVLGPPGYCRILSSLAQRLPQGSFGRSPMSTRKKHRE